MLRLDPRPPGSSGASKTKTVFCFKAKGPGLDVFIPRPGFSQPILSRRSQACGRLASRFGGVLCSSSVQHAEELERLFEPGGPVTRG